jgi:hypothetical protein
VNPHDFLKGRRYPFHGTCNERHARLPGTKHRDAASYELWRQQAYAWKRIAARTTRRRDLGTAAGGTARSMDTGEHPARRLERRWAPRYAFRATVEIEWGSAVLRASTRDISSNGMFIESPDTLWIGAGFTARLDLDHPVKLDCFVKRIEPGRGMGVTVVLSEPQIQKHYQDFIASLSRT